MTSQYTAGLEHVQLGLARRLLGRARHVLDGPRPGAGELAPLAAQLACALGDTLLIAETRCAYPAGAPSALGGAAHRSEPESLAVRRLPGTEPASAPAARRFVRNAARAWEVPRDLVDTLEVVTSELVTNALVHGGGETVTVALALTGRVLTLGVTDEGRGPVGAAAGGLPEAAPDEAESGRGLVIVSALADRWGRSRGPGGLTVWAEVGVAGGDAG
ncbi:ATP-binding protein [Streptomyces sp. NPDC050703]|uniref:ATP-binding protein n=1 Tax=Streptomyces sp. NPDC050703 TaxID=3157218 RepID=UPI0034473F89